MGPDSWILAELLYANFLRCVLYLYHRCPYAFPQEKAWRSLDLVPLRAANLFCIFYILFPLIICACLAALRASKQEVLERPVQVSFNVGRPGPYLVLAPGFLAAQSSGPVAASEDNVLHPPHTDPSSLRS